MIFVQHKHHDVRNIPNMYAMLIYFSEYYVKLVPFSMLKSVAKISICKMFWTFSISESQFRVTGLRYLCENWIQSSNFCIFSTMPTGGNKIMTEVWNPLIRFVLLNQGRFNESNWNIFKIDLLFKRFFPVLFTIERIGTFLSTL